MATKGPWRFDKSQSKIVSETEFMDEENPVTVISTYGAMGGDDVNADALLIASAPELYDALQEMIKNCTMMKEDTPYLIKAKNAIQKANYKGDKNGKS